jgi:2-oxoglutarate ferredoxin oxidoreductase subunit gamma
LGDKRLTNMVMLGAMLAKLPVLPIEDIEAALAEHIPERHKYLLPLNSKALRRGADYAQNETVLAV